jgi:hypothetical protein
MKTEEQKQRILQIFKVFYILIYSYAWILFFYTTRITGMAKIVEMESIESLIWIICLFFLIFSWLGLAFWTFYAALKDRLGAVGLGTLFLFLLPAVIFVLGPELGHYAFPWGYFH